MNLPLNVMNVLDFHGFTFNASPLLYTVNMSETDTPTEKKEAEIEHLFGSKARNGAFSDEF